MLTKYQTQCLLGEPAPDYGGVLLSAAEQCWQGQLAPDRDPQGKLIQGEETKKVQSTGEPGPRSRQWLVGQAAELLPLWFKPR